MAQPPATSPTLTEEAFAEDRAEFWQGFCSASTAAVAVVGIIVVLMAIFLV